MIKKKKRIIEDIIFKRVSSITFPRCLNCKKYKYEQCPTIHLGILCDIANYYEIHSKYQYVLI